MYSNNGINFAEMISDQVQAILFSVRDGVIVTDAEEKVTYMNPSAEQVTGWSAINAKGELFNRIFFSDGQVDLKTDAGLLEKALKTQDLDLPLPNS